MYSVGEVSGGEGRVHGHEPDVVTGAHTSSDDLRDRPVEHPNLAVVSRVCERWKGRDENGRLWADVGDHVDECAKAIGGGRESMILNHVVGADRDEEDLRPIGREPAWEASRNLVDTPARVALVLSVGSAASRSITAIADG